ncbi:7300_t:CDS:2 [Funneliformis geosporum]|uniref:7300_t:CDS:1 n=1 Tax=Funneliformis geosporum TaxID=1117311 RepID=A0A9W4SEB7_9GLOM|nr:7300_t:CDS:2 [Funneliformis geosporum]
MDDQRGRKRIDPRTENLPIGRDPNSAVVFHALPRHDNPETTENPEIDDVRWQDREHTVHPPGVNDRKGIVGHVEKDWEKEMAFIDTYQTYNIKIGEGTFCLSSESLNRDAPNFFTAAFFGHFSEANTTSIFIDRDPTNFSMIVKYLRMYEVDWPVKDKISMKNLLEDVKYYGFERLQNLLEENYEKHFPEKVIPWKILTYAPEKEPIVAINIKDVELERWDSRSLIYNANPILKMGRQTSSKEIEVKNNDETNEVTNDDLNVENNDEETEFNNETNPNVIEPSPEKGLYRLEVHGRNALATVTSNLSNGIKFENFVMKDAAEDATFRVLTESFRTPEGTLTLSPSLKLSFLKDTCIEIDNIRYNNHNDLLSYLGVNARGKPFYFEEIVIRVDSGAFLMRARAWTIPSYYASQPFVCSVQSQEIP